MEEIKPLIEEAKQAVGNIKSNTLSEIRSLRAPPGRPFVKPKSKVTDFFIKILFRILDVIRDVLEGVLCLMGTQDLSWNSMKSFLAKRGVKGKLILLEKQLLIIS